IKAKEEIAILKANKRNVVWTVGGIIVIALVVLGSFFRLQNQHLARVRQMESQVQQAERLGALGRLTAGVAHEVRNPLNAISLAVQRLHRERPGPITELIRDEIRRLNQIVEDFVGVARNSKVELQPGNLVEVLDNVFHLMDPEAKARGIVLNADYEIGVCQVLMNPDKLKQAVINILKNAIEASADSGKVQLTLLVDAGRWAMVAIHDTGEGLPPEDCDRLFEPGFTTKEKGLGLGLALAHEIVGAHGGKIVMKGNTAVGTTVELRLPLWPGGTPASTEEA
ncbi:two-component system sensor histidine kinase NtrB, partial [Trichloromonas sp.]|uniref:two-component system sensor histidine kinase NtrB n=1 Tax=Trichloromonas sp. TaxID=3069249 RepID=UPI003D819FB4